jgi:hypothetical protein
MGTRSKNTDPEREQLEEQIKLLFGSNPRLKQMVESLNLDTASIEQLRLLAKTVGSGSNYTSSERSYPEPRRSDPAMTSGRR